MWRDELQAWLIARDCAHGIIGLWNCTAYEGHPLLWFAILRPLTTFFTAASMQVLCIVLTVGATYLAVRHGPFTREQRWLLPFGALFIYEYSIVCRSYILVLFLLTLFCVAYDKRRRYLVVIGLLLALLANVSIHGTIIAIVLSGCLALELAIRRRQGVVDIPAWRQTAGAGVLIVTGIILAVATSIPPPDSSVNIRWNWNWNTERFVTLLALLRNLWLPATAGMVRLSIPENLMLTVSLGFWLAFAVRFRTNRVALSFFVGSTLAGR